MLSAAPVVKPLTAFQGELDLTMLPPLGFILLYLIPTRVFDAKL
ncbi:MAG: hypothetical protein CM15mV40_280 [Caudoviricetes sp.]|nr:MAG: hypothetical protein CM15mV40_280 [Caudoviricetes sp.]